MSRNKRVTLTPREINHIVYALKQLQNETSLSYAVIEAGKKAYQDIIVKLIGVEKVENDNSNK